jgi:PAS domain S-box-containing protein
MKSHLLETSELRYRRVFEAAQDGILLLNAVTGAIEDANPFMTELLGYTHDEFLGKHLWEIGLFQDIEQSKTAFRELQENGYIRYEDLPLQGKNGVRRQVEFVSNVYEVADQKAVQCNIRDITERKLAEKKAVRMERQLQEQSQQLAGEARSKDEFLAMLAHELRNPMAPICNGIDVLRMLPPKGGKAKQILDVMEEQTRNLVRLIDDLLDVSRVTRGKLELRSQRVALATIVTNAVQTAEPLMQAKGHELTVTQAGERLHVHGDPTRLTQIVANLLHNAAKYTPQGGMISLSTARDGDDAVIRVKDNGIGIASEMLPRIFEMFVQADKSLSRTHGGLGIGLTLVQNLVAMHGGSVEAKSDGLGSGSEFTVRLPILQASEVLPHDANTLPDKARSFPVNRILIVDDVPPAALLVAIMLQAKGQQVRTAESGAEALAMIEEEKPTLVLSDISMPGMSGYDLAHEIRRRPQWNDIRLVALTGFGQESDKRLSQEAGFNAHLVKPIGIEDLECLLCG